MAANNSLLELRASYDEFLRTDRFGYTDRIGTAIDDHVQRSAAAAARGGSNKSASGGADSATTTGGGGPAGGSLIGHPRLRIPLSELRSHDARLSNALMRDPLRHIRALEAAAHDVGLEERPGYDKNHVRMRVALGGPIGSKPMGPRELGSSSLRRLVCVEGVAVKVSSVKPKVVQSVHYCPVTRQHEARSYVDATDPELGLPQVGYC